MIIDIGAVLVVVFVIAFVIAPAMGSAIESTTYWNYCKYGWAMLGIVTLLCIAGAVILALAYIFLISCAHVLQMMGVLS